MSTQEKTTQTILANEARNIQLAIAKLQQLTEKEGDTLSLLEKLTPEEKEDPELTLVEAYERGVVNFSLKFFGPNLSNYGFTDIDDEIHAAMVQLITESGWEISEPACSYDVYHTPPETKGEEYKRRSDPQIIHHLQIRELSTLKEILANAYDLVADDLANCGQLCRIAKTGQENLNLGYCELKDVFGNTHVYVIFLEKKKMADGEKRIYHLHCSRVPRDYKPQRYMLIKK